MKVLRTQRVSKYSVPRILRASAGEGASRGSCHLYQQITKSIFMHVHVHLSRGNPLLRVELYTYVQTTQALLSTSDR